MKFGQLTESKKINSFLKKKKKHAENETGRVAADFFFSFFFENLYLR